jgi:hypothetical protein
VRSETLKGQIHKLKEQIYTSIKGTLTENEVKPKLTPDIKTAEMSIEDS